MVKRETRIQGVAAAGAQGRGRCRRHRRPGRARSRAARRRKGKIVVGTWGGDYARLLNKNIEQPILITKGWEVVQDQAGDPQRRSKMLAEKRLPRGTTDVQGLSATQHVPDARRRRDRRDRLRQAQERRQPAAVDEVSLRRRPHLLGQGRRLQPEAHGRPRPKSYKDVFDPKHGNKLGIIDIQYQYTLVAAALAAGGKVERPRARQEAAARVQEGGRAHLPDQRGVRAGPQDRGVRRRHHVEGARGAVAERRHQRARPIAPTEGALAYVSGFVIPKNAPNKDGSYAYLDAMLEQVGAGGLRRRHGLQPDRQERQGGARSQQAHRLHAGGDRGARRSRLLPT